MDRNAPAESSHPASEPSSAAVKSVRRSRYIPRRRDASLSPLILLSVTIAAIVAAGFAMALTGVLASFVAGIVTGNESAGSTPLVKFVTIVAGEGTFALIAFLAARSETTNVRQRLGIVRPRISVGTMACVAVGTILFPTLGLLAYQLTNAKDWLGSSDAEYSALAATLASMPIAWKVLMILVVGLAPGICEEMLYRGLLLRGLSRRWPAWAAVLVSGILFEASHLSLMHLFINLLTGIWLGYVAVRCAAIIPGMMAHAFNNTFWSILTAFVLSSAGTDVRGLESWAPVGILIAISAPAAIIAIWRIEVAARRHPDAVAAPES